MIRNAIQHLMYGRYGHDQLNLFLMVLYLLLYLVYMLTGWELFSLCSLLLLAYTLFRLLSRDHAKRRRENARFMRMAGPVLQWLRLRRTIRKDKEHMYFKCPNCGQQLRVPRGKGNITVRQLPQLRGPVRGQKLNIPSGFGPPLRRAAVFSLLQPVVA